MHRTTRLEQPDDGQGFRRIVLDCVHDILRESLRLDSLPGSRMVLPKSICIARHTHWSVESHTNRDLLGDCVASPLDKVRLFPIAKLHALPLRWLGTPRNHISRNFGFSRIRELHASPPACALDKAGFSISVSHIGISAAKRFSISNRRCSRSACRFSSTQYVKWKSITASPSHTTRPLKRHQKMRQDSPAARLCSIISFQRSRCTASSSFDLGGRCTILV